MSFPPIASRPPISATCAAMSTAVWVMPLIARMDWNAIPEMARLISVTASTASRTGGTGEVRCTSRASISSWVR